MIPGFMLHIPPTISLPNDRQLSTHHCAYVMGILNITTDSFWEKSRVLLPEEAAERAVQMVMDGADVIDLGAESTRPGAAYVDAATEIERLIPVLRAIRQKTDVPISIDTRKCAVMRECFDAGADIVNDVSALSDDSALGEFAASVGMPVILMHKSGIPAMMQDNPKYAMIVDEVCEYLQSAAAHAVQIGIDRNKIILDPGIGFGKNCSHNRELIAATERLSSLGYPLLMALSRKRFIAEITGHHDASELLAGTLTANLVAVLLGASMIRVHDVRQAHDSLLMLESLLQPQIHTVV